MKYFTLKNLHREIKKTMEKKTACILSSTFLLSIIAIIFLFACQVKYQMEELTSHEKELQAKQKSPTLGKEVTTPQEEKLTTFSKKISIVSSAVQNSVSQGSQVLAVFRKPAKQKTVSMEFIRCLKNKKPA